MNDEKKAGQTGTDKTGYERKRRVWLRRGALIVCAALVCGAVIAGPLLKRRNGKTGQTESFMGIEAVLASYPDPVAPDMSVQKYLEGDAHGEWWAGVRESVEQSRELQAGMDGYYLSLMQKTLASQDDNTVCSPLNAYLAFAILAETTDGQSRQQILDMLGVSDMKALRENATVLWESNYADTPALKSILSNSLWLTDGVEYKDAALADIARYYYASSFTGTPGSAEMDEALRKWTDDSTGGLLSEYTKDLSLDDRTVLEILSAVYYKAMWREEFHEEENTQEIFHGTNGDSEAEMMHRTTFMSAYRTETFTALGLGLTDSGGMYFFLPEEGRDVNDLLTDPRILCATRFDEEDDNWFTPVVHLSVPKFSVSAKTDLTGVIEELGVTDVLDPEKADFSPLTENVDELHLTKAEHAAVVEIDEQGVTGAAYTALGVTANGAAVPDDEIDFTLDRPFLFVVTGRDGAVLFAGVVRNLDQE